ncbi:MULTISPECIES: DMT family transporter [unclassified Rhizobium]|uniref:DMT family transporter n=1 Tax=unclassified Rhizobium TaxID=2613769 RepID=UPI001ADB3A28|nr:MULTISPECIES: DMT family transporter [unclassified Rhizobium]MBO9099276.1 DMT family transporter [Rhizobium sp. L58/93]MBO9169538.1 DMT family transporter [Rhizobium sp. L245/93]MBO9185489.1 DMT family transporter [Rhizobium sp. E27B/91]MBO9131918.1 DMT family transporter [Rhizobium sp. B209b/85]QXZ85622.1 DMT family transporter [Rhizobium sp. K1/93]
MTLAEQSQYRLGVLYVALSALAWSSAGLFMRAIHADLMTILFYRGIVSGGGVFLLFLFIERGGAWRIIGAMRGPSFAAMFFSTGAMISGIGSIYYTSVADSMVIYATVPFITAGVAFLYIRERPSAATMIAAGVALVGVLVMLMGDSTGSGSWFGRALAAIMTLMVAGLAVVMRRHRDVPMLPAMAASGWLCSLVCFWFASPGSVSGSDAGLIVAFGLIQNALGLSLYTFGSRLIPAADASLLTALEVPLTPLWVWIFFSETPSSATMIGGPIVLVALFGHIFTEVRRNRAPMVVNPG